MAWLQERSDSYRVVFRYQGKQRTFTLGKVTQAEAEAKLAQVDYILMRLRQRLLALPPGVDIETFIQFDGSPPAAAIQQKSGPSTVVGDLRERYIQAHGGALEANTLGTARIHLNHLSTTLGEKFPLAELSAVDLQRHVDRRIKEGVSPVTVRKEINGLRTAWNWGKRIGLVSGAYPNEGLVYPKTDEKPPFQTMEEIERRIRRGGLSEDQVSELWDSLFLTLPEIAELLDHVKRNAAHPWIYPLICMAAHTGARRGELLRMEVADVDLERDSVLIRERKRVKGRRTTRRAPLSPTLKKALVEWLESHPGGNPLFCHGPEVARSKKRSRTTGHMSGEERPKTLKGRKANIHARDEVPEIGPLTESECHDHFKRTLADSKWSVVRGLHVCRHSFISGLAAEGIDQRIIDDIVGHQTEQQRQRYRHLTPESKKNAVGAVFG